MSCPEPSALQAYLEGHAADDERARLRSHLERCDACRKLVLALAPSASPAPAPAAAAAPAPTLGELIGRYVVSHRLGEGGMGVVYAAYDPELDRRVALKLIRGTFGGDASARELQDRLVREAQAMARIAHPNVVTVHDVGRHGDQVFVAMELIDGETLQQWLARAPRSRAEVLDVFARAGRGLAAAHAAGLVHRDFKPNNVMIDRDGRVRVTDFGLARTSGVPDVGGGALSPARVERALTASGALMGTPAYMAPEQLARDPVDARTDQFSFCVALYEALSGTRPFTAADTDELRAAILASRLARPQKRVPRRLLAAVERGLAPSPDARWPSLDALLAELARDPSRRNRRALLVAGVACAAAVLGVAWQRAERARGELCAGADRKLAGVWDDARRRDVERAFNATGLSYAPATFATVAARFDSYTAGWVAARTDACQATRLRGEQSEELLDLRMSCLDDRLGQLSSLVVELARADRGVVQRAISAASALPEVAACSDVKALRERTPPPRDRAERAKVDALSARLHDVIALFDTGKYQAALPLAESLRRDAAALGYAPLSCRAEMRLGDLLLRVERFPDAVRELEAAGLDALRGHDDEQAGAAWSSLGYAEGVYFGHVDEALAWFRLAQAAYDRAGLSERGEARVAGSSSTVLQGAGRPLEARAAAERAVELYRKLEPAGSMKLDWALATLASTYAQQGHPERAFELRQQVVADYEKQRGADNPETVAEMSNLALDLTVAGRAAEALPLGDRALAIAERTNPPDSPVLVILLVNRAWALLKLERFADALPSYQRAVVIAEKTQHPTLATALGGIGLCELGLGHPQRAVAPLERVQLELERLHASPIDRAPARFDLARALYQTGKRERARTLAAQAASAYAEAAAQFGGTFVEREREVREWLARPR
jgi:tetratricopeptide (TPR) repeat protein